MSLSWLKTFRVFVGLCLTIGGTFVLGHLIWRYFHEVDSPTATPFDRKLWSLDAYYLGPAGILMLMMGIWWVLSALQQPGSSSSTVIGAKTTEARP
jgi:hypothetical protein